MLTVCVSASSTVGASQTCQLRDWLGTTATSDDARMAGLIQRATGWAETMIGYPLLAQVYSETVKGTGSRHLMLARTPIRGVLRLFDSTATCEATAILASEFRVEDAEAGFLSRDRGFEWSNVEDTFLTSFVRPNMDRKPWLVEYTAGWTLTGMTSSSAVWATQATSTGRDLPYDIEQAILMKAADWYAGVDIRMRSKSVGDLSITYSEGLIEAEQMLAPYRRLA